MIKIDSSSGDDKKLDIITFYNATKGGVGMVDQMDGKYDTSRNSRDWPLTVFSSMLNVSTINAYVLYCHKPENKRKRRFFIKSMCMQLIEDNLKRRMQNIRPKRISAKELKDCCQKVQKPSNHKDTNITKHKKMRVL